MITGLGTDIIKISKIKEMVKKYGHSFKQRIFTKKELIKAEEHINIYQHLAGRMAAKEAFSKALGYGIGKKCAWKNITIVNNHNGKPLINLSGEAQNSIYEHGVKNIHLTISHESEFAIATVILES